MKVIFSPVRVTGLDKIDFSKAHVYAVNHGSALDIPMLYAYLPFQFRILHKKELLSYPIVGWHLKRSGQVCVDQQHPSRSVGQIKSAVRTLKNGMPLVIFPEGGRSADGHIQPFLPGAFFMAIKAEVDIVPIALVGTYELLPMDTYHIKSASAGDAGRCTDLDCGVDSAGYGDAVGEGAEGDWRGCITRKFLTRTRIGVARSAPRWSSVRQSAGRPKGTVCISTA